MDAQLEQAVLVQRQGGAIVAAGLRGGRFDGVVVGDHGHQTGLGHPLQQLVVTPVEHGAGIVQRVRVRRAAHIHQHLAEAGVEADHVSLFHRHPVLAHDPLQVGELHQLALAPVMRVQVDHDGAALHARLRHVLDAQGAGAAGRLARPGRHAGVLDVAGPDNMFAAAEPVVEHPLPPPVAIRVEQAADMGEAVPLGRILQIHHGEVVAEHVGMARRAVVADEVRHAVAQRRPQHRREAARVEVVAARQIERQAQAEILPGLHLRDPLQHLLRRDVIHPATLVVGPELAPIGARWAVLEPWRGRHRATPTALPRYGRASERSIAKRAAAQRDRYAAGSDA